MIYNRLKNLNKNVWLANNQKVTIVPKRIFTIEE